MAGGEFSSEDFGGAFEELERASIRILSPRAEGGAEVHGTLTSKVEPKATSKRHSRHLPISWIFSAGGSEDCSEAWEVKFGKTWPMLRSASCNPGTAILGSGRRGLWERLWRVVRDDCHARCPEDVTLPRLRLKTLFYLGNSRDHPDIDY